MKLTKTGIGLLTRQYLAVLRKCLLINAGLFFVFTPNVAEAVDVGTFSYGKATITITELEPHGSVSGWDGQKSVAIRNHINADNITRALIHTTEIAYHTISQDKTIVQNLEALDALIGAYPSYNGMYTFANGAFLAQAKANNIGVQSMDTGASVLQNLVQLDFVVGSLQNGTYISKLSSMGDNIKSLDTAVAGKQATLTTAQLNAANSGITSTKVSAYDGYADTIATKATLDEVREINDLNNYYTKYGLGGKKQLSSLAVYENNPSSLAVCGASPRQGILSFGVAASISDMALRKGQIAGRSDAQRTSSDDNVGFAAANDNHNDNLLMPTSRASVRVFARGVAPQLEKTNCHPEAWQNMTRHPEEAHRADVGISSHRFAALGRNDTAISLTTADARRRMRLPRPDGLAMTHSFIAAANDNYKTILNQVA